MTDVEPSMKVAMYYRNDDIRIEEMPRPHIGPDELLVKVMACGICGSDVMEWYRVRTAPRVLGHELAGDVVQVGEKVKGFAPGERVMVTHHVPCNECHYCQMGHHSVCDTLRTTNFDPGGFSEYLRVPAINVDRGTYGMPGSMSYDQGTFIEPLACAVRGQRHAGVGPQRSVLVVGSGMSGLLHVMLARALGAGPVLSTDVSAYKRECALKVGADGAFAAEDDVPALVSDANGGRLPDVVILCAGVGPALRQAAQCVGRGGTLLLFAPPPPDGDIPLPLMRYWKDEVTVTTSYAGPPDDIRQAIDLISSGRVDVDSIVTHRLPLESTGEGFALAASGKESIKVIIYPHGDP